MTPFEESQCTDGAVRETKKLAREMAAPCGNIGLSRLEIRHGGRGSGGAPWPGVSVYFSRRCNLFCFYGLRRGLKIGGRR
ncbi:hypothetical protein SBA4_1360013 [Candidatus Sulfopaludibacter sp. SbA4]|nr:hypothetical protein SBA4_1360013 [Candidatus Sulfopaludibacter sp. SbA4]